MCWRHVVMPVFPPKMTQLSYNESRRDALFLKFISYMFRTCPLFINSVSQHCIHTTGICHSSSVGCLLAWSGWNWSSILPTLAEANRTRMTNTYCVYTVLRYSWWWTVDISETCRVLYQINVRNCVCILLTFISKIYDDARCSESQILTQHYSNIDMQDIWSNLSDCSNDA